MRRFLLLSFVVLACLCSTPKDARLSRITFARGQIQVMSPGANARTAEAGEVLHHADTIKTGKDSYAEIMVEDIGIFRISEDSEMNLEELRNKQKTIIRLDKGKAGFFLLKIPANQDVGIRLPTSVAGVRGTKFLASAGADGASKVALFGGAVSVTDPKNKSVILDKPGEVRLKTGESLENKKIEPLSAESLADMKKLEELLPLDLQKVPMDPALLNQMETAEPDGSDLKKP